MRSPIRAALTDAALRRRLTAARDARQTATPAPLATLTRGQRIRISHPDRGQVDNAVALHVETPAHLPSISGAPEVDRVRAILAERQIQQLALIEYDQGTRTLIFAAFGDGKGKWWDLQQQELTITRTSQVRRPRP